MRKLANITELDDFYRTEEWYRVAEQIKLESGGKCAKCGVIVPDWRRLIVHHYKIHLTQENMKDASISLNRNNLQAVCFDCHNKEHNRFGHSNQKVYIVYGSPCAGKSTWVKDHMKRGDLVFDIDRIWHALSGQEMFDKPSTLNKVVFNARDKIIDDIYRRHGQWSNAFIIGGYPDKQRRDELAHKLKAELVYIKATKEECLDRLYKDQDRVKYHDKWEQYINEWFENIVE